MTLLNTMNSENDLNCVYVAKNIAPYLTLTFPEGYCHDLHDIKIFQKNTFPEEFKNIVEYLKSQGLESEKEQDAFTVAEFTGICLGRIVHREGTGVIFFNGRNQLEDYLSIALDDGIKVLTGDYGNPPNLINQEFKNQSRDYLLKEIYSRLENRIRIKLLDSIIIESTNTDVIILRSYKKDPCKGSSR